VAGENMGPAKLQKAEKLGVKILSESDFIELLGGETQNNAVENIVKEDNDKRENKNIDDFVQGSLF
jgi:BRCT domain type II-containing protein